MTEINIIEETKKLLEQMQKSNMFMEKLEIASMIAWLAKKSDEIFLVHKQKNNKALEIIQEIKEYQEIDLASSLTEKDPSITLPVLFIIPGAQKSSEPVIGAIRTKRNILLPTGKKIKFSYENMAPNSRVLPIGHFVL